MKKELNPIVPVLVIAVLVIIIGVFGYKYFNQPSGSNAHPGDYQTIPGGFKNGGPGKLMPNGQMPGGAVPAGR